MSLVRLRLLTVAIAAMFASVAFNLFALQGQHRAVVASAAGGAGSASASKATSPADLAATADADRSLSVIGDAPEPRPLNARQVRGQQALVQAIQRELASKGYDAGKADGVSGLATRAAVLAYEYDHGLALTATPSDDLLEALILGLPRIPGGARRSYSSAAHSVVRTVQGTLKALGYDPGGVDGHQGPKTQAAIERFERAAGLPISGRVSGRLIKALAASEITAQVSRR